MENMVNKSFLSFWKKKRVFITGHTGFKGSWMVFLLQYLGCKVGGYSLKPKKKVAKIFLEILEIIDILRMQ